MVIQVPLADWGYGDDMTGCPYYNQKGEKLNLTEIALLDAVDGIAVAYDWVTHKRFYIDESGKQCIADTFDGGGRISGRLCSGAEGDYGGRRKGRCGIGDYKKISRHPKSKTGFRLVETEE